MLFDLSVQDFRKTLLLAVFLPLTAVAAETGSADAARSGHGDSGDNGAVSADFTPTQPFPRWPEHARYQREIVPPPPPGPYMSSALSDFSVKGPVFPRQAGHMQAYPPVQDMRQFSPDRPWPDDLRPTHRWKPEQGYHYVSPRPRWQPPAYPDSGSRPLYRAPAPAPYQPIRPRHNSPRYSGPSYGGQNHRAHHQGLPSGPVMHVPGSRGKPAMGFDSRSYPRPAYRSHHGTGYQPAARPMRSYPAAPQPPGAP